MNQTGSIQKFTRVAFAGLCISFLGALPLGTMNIAATHISIQQGTHAGLVYAFGSMLVEIIVVRIVLVAMDWLAKRHKIFRLLELVTTGLIVALAAASFIAAYKMKSFSGAIPISRSLSPFWTGVLLSAANPLHIPFWLGWSTVLLNKNILLPSAGYYNWYITGIGTGTMLGFMVFVYGGNYMVSRITHHQEIVHLSIGSVLLLTAIIQVKKMITVPLAIRYGRKTE